MYLIHIKFNIFCLLLILSFCYGLRLDIQQSKTPWKFNIKYIDVVYNDNEKINMTCSEDLSVIIPLIWLKNGVEQRKTTSMKTLSYELTNLTHKDDGTNITCVMENGENIVDSASVILKYNRPYQEHKEQHPEDQHTKLSTTNATEGTQLQKTDTQKISIEWIAMGSAIVVLIVMIIILVVWWCKPRRAPATHEISYKNFQNIYTEHERTEVDPTYSGPVDELYCYATNQSITQDTYSTPFVPTIDEMYTQPTPKVLRKQIKPTHPSLSKIRNETLPNRKKATPNQPDPGYNTVGGRDDDIMSDLYSYSSLSGYSRPK